MTDLVMKYAADKADKAPGPRPPCSPMTSSGNVTLTPEEWAKAEANVKEYRNFFT